MTEKELQVILQEGEGYRIEFKEALSGLDKERLQSWSKPTTHDFSRGTNKQRASRNRFNGFRTVR